LLAEVRNYPPNFFSSIEKDICRTFTDQNNLQQHLRNVLFAYAIRNPRLLYCQGLNYLVAYFLMRDYSEQQSFWLLVQLVEDILPVDYYVDMGAVIGLSNVLNDLLRETMLGFVEHCQEIRL
jgi:predicted RNA-binding protein associated with RNAse of E/G family